MPIIYHEGYSLGGSSDANQILKDTVGWIGKNRIDVSKTNGSNATITNLTQKGFTVNATNITYGSSKTPLALEVGKEYIASVNVTANTGSGTRITVRDSLNVIKASKAFEGTGKQELKFTYQEGYYFSVFASFSPASTGSITVDEVMVRDASITDDTYEPYHESVETMYEEEIHGVNLFNPNFTKKTEYGVTFTVNADKTISTNGTTTADARTVFGKVFLKEGTYTLSGNPYNVATNTIRLRLYNSSETKIFWDDGNGVTFTVNSSEEYTLAVRYGSGAVFGSTFKPMLRKADIDDSTYRPYNPQAIQNQLNDKGVLGAKNKFAYPWVTKSATLGGITFTDNDGYSLTVNGTATNNTQFDFFNASNRMGGLETGRKYILSGAPKTSLNTNDTKLQLTFRDSNDTASSQITVVCPQGGEIEFTIPEGYRPWYFVYFVRSGVTINNLVVKPMIRLASDPDDTYQPYAMTNRELTEKRFEKRILSSGDDLNNITETGIYLVATSVSNVPENRANLTLIVNGFDSTQIRQVLMTKEAMYTRSKEGATWKPWYKYTGTVVS